MNRAFYTLYFFSVFGILILTCSPQNNDSQINKPPFTLSYTGAMRNVMHKGELFATIATDTIRERAHLYGVGPLEYLKGEIVILDGVTYVSQVLSDSTMEVREVQGAKAPFLVYANVPEWEEHPLPDSIITTKQLDSYLNATVTGLARPFPFLMTGAIRSAVIHVQNLPEGTNIHAPEDARRGQVLYTIPPHTQVRMAGFFSTEHQGVFTHRDSFTHIHLLTDDKTMMGHVDSLELPDMKKDVLRLFIPRSRTK